MSAHRTSFDAKPLSHSVSECLDDYFRSLNGHSPAELYDMILDQVEPPLRKKLRHHRITAKPAR